MHSNTQIKKMFLELRARSLTLVSAESLTGGLFGASLTRISGSSEVYQGGVVSYSVEAKERILGVDPSLINTCGVVSRETAEAMAFGALSLCSADISVSLTGIAGPLGGTIAVPAGTVWIAVAKRRSGSVATVESRCFHFSGSRSRVRSLSVRSAAALVIAQLDTE